jgi:hypothetical protein
MWQRVTHSSLLPLLLLLAFAKASVLPYHSRAVLLLWCAVVCVQLCCQAGPVLQEVCCTHQGVGGADGCGRRLLQVVCQLLPVMQQSVTNKVQPKPC